VLSITPHIIRAQSRPSSDTAEFWYGTESQARSAPFGALPPSAPQQGAAPASAAMGSTVGSASASTANGAAFTRPAVPGSVTLSSGGDNTPPVANNNTIHAAPQRLEAVTGAATATQAASPPQTATAPQAATASQATAPQATTPPSSRPPGKPTVSIEGPDTAKVGQEFDVAVRLASATAPGRVRAQVRFDATALQLISAEPGDLAPSGDEPKVQLKPGGVQLELAGQSDAAVGESGTIVNLRFRAVAARPSQIATQVVLVGENGTAMAATPATPLNLVISQ